MTKDIKEIKSFLELGSDVTSSGIGAVIGFLMGNLPGAAAGAMIAPCAKKILGDIINRTLSTREKLRVADTTIFTIEKIVHNLNSGMKPRDDGFFNRSNADRSEADEIFEGVLLKAKNEHEEKKTKILGNIYANIAFSKGFSAGEANYLLQIFDRLTYRQLCVLALIIRKKKNTQMKLRNTNYRTVERQVFYETISILQEIYEMYSLGLVVSKEPTKAKSYTALIGWYDITPVGLKLTFIGKRYCKIMGLDDVPEQELKEIAKYLS